MKLPITVDNLMELWSKDAPIDETEPGRELIKIASLHSQYLRIMTHHNLIAKKQMSDYLKLKKLKVEYYKGDLNNPDDLKQYGYEPFTKIPGRDIGIYIDSDEELNNLLLKKVINEEIVEFCKAVLKELSNRTWQLKTYIDYERFIGGQ